MVTFTPKQYQMILQGVSSLVMPQVNAQNINAAIQFAKEQAELIALIKQAEQEQNASLPA